MHLYDIRELPDHVDRIMTTSVPDPIPHRLDRGADGRTTGPALDGFAQFFFDTEGMAHSVYYTGNRQHPALLVMPEIAGFSPGLLLLVRRLAAARFQIYVPWLFGPFGRRRPVRNALQPLRFARVRPLA
ncbi:MAG: hypothetical protein WDO56_17685 [Gammaproteobacteria bacterium]